MLAPVVGHLKRSADVVAHRKRTAALVRKIRSHLLGTIKRGKTSSLHVKLRKLGLSRLDITQTIAWDLANSLGHRDFIAALRKRSEGIRREIRAIENSFDDLDHFLIQLAQHHKSIFVRLSRKGNDQIQTVISQRMVPWKRLFFHHQQLSELQDRLKRAIATDPGIAEKRRTDKQHALNRATAYLCFVFFKKTGLMQYGIVARLLIVSGLEKDFTSPNEYAAARDRVKKRVAEWAEKDPKWKKELEKLKKKKKEE